MPPYLCRFCGHSLTMHPRGAHCQALDCRCEGLGTHGGAPAPEPVTAVTQREAYIASVRASLRRPDAIAEVEDHVRAAYDAGFCAASRVGGG